MIRNQYNYRTPSVQDTKGKEKRNLKQRHHNQNTKSKKPRGWFLSQNLVIQYRNFTRTYLQRHTMTEIGNHNRSTALERLVKSLLCVCVCVLGWVRGWGEGVCVCVCVGGVQVLPAL